jgi:hypothetical protein
MQHNLNCPHETGEAWIKVAPTVLNQTDVSVSYDDNTLRYLARKGQKAFGCYNESTDVDVNPNPSPSDSVFEGVDLSCLEPHVCKSDAELE